jgi:hypothetical protein
LDSVYNRSTSVDRTVLGLLSQLQVVDELADEPSAAEVAEHLKKARRSKAPGESGLTVECFQALADDAEMLASVHACILDFWLSKTACLAQPAALRMQELGADSVAPPTAEYVPQPLRARDGIATTHFLLQH